MSAYTQDTQVSVASFSRQTEGDGVIIGIAETGAFLVLPADAVEILDHLAAGKTVGEAQAAYLQKYGENPDMADFLQALEKKGFVRPLASGFPAQGIQARLEAPRASQRRHHFDRIPRSVAAVLFGTTAVKICWLIIILAVLASAFEPGIVPDRNALYFARNRTLNAFSLFFLGYVAVFLHEMGHLIAARAVGVGSRMSIGHRLWILVAETDLTGLWSVPKQDRYLPLLAGPLVDAVSASLLLLTLFAHARAWIALPGAVAPLLEALVFLYIMRILWQCFFFVRTDFYYVIASFFNCRNLLADTETFLGNKLARFGFLSPRGQDHIPPAEMRIIRAYSPIWLTGRLLAFWVLFFVTLPVAFRYLQDIVHTFRIGYSADAYAFVDSILLILLTLTPLAGGLYLWLRSSIRSWSRDHGKATHAT
jgi:putative peptide zinc metalloprotease protein